MHSTTIQMGWQTPGGMTAGVYSRSFDVLCYHAGHQTSSVPIHLLPPVNLQSREENRTANKNTPGTWVFKHFISLLLHSALFWLKNKKHHTFTLGNSLSILHDRKLIDCSELNGLLHCGDIFLRVLNSNLRNSSHKIQVT